MFLCVGSSLCGGAPSCTALGGYMACGQVRASDKGSQQSQGRGAGEEPVQGRWHQLRGKGAWWKPIDEDASSSWLPKVGGLVGLKRLALTAVPSIAPSAAGSFDATSPCPTTHQSTHCPRDTARNTLHSSQWPGMCYLQLRDPNSAPTEARRIRCPHPVILCTDALQLDLPSEQRPQVPGVLPEERWSEDLGEGACDLRWWDKLERGGRGWLDEPD